MNHERSVRALPQDHGGYLFRFSSGPTSVTCLVSEPALHEWFACHALRDLRDPPQDRRFGLLAADGSARPAWQRVAEAVEVPAHTPLSSPCDASEGLTP